MEIELGPDATRSVGDVGEATHQQVDQKRGTSPPTSHKVGGEEELYFVSAFAKKKYMTPI